MESQRNYEIDSSCLLDATPPPEKAISYYLSIVSPVYQAETIVDELVDRLITNLEELTAHFEIILVEDGSKDASWAKIEENCKKDPRIKGIKLSRNFGQHFAITAGIDNSQGQWVIVLDCDLQDRPEEIKNLLYKAKDGFEIVLAKRINRQDGYFKSLSSKVFYRFLSFLSGTQYDSSTANFGIYHRNVIQSILKMREKIRFFPAMINWVGFNKTFIGVTHGKGLREKSSYNLRKLLKLSLDIILAYSDKPLRLIVYLGLFFSFTAFVLGLVMIYKFFRGGIHVLGYASLITCICFFSGIIISVVGIIALYIGKIFEGIKNRPSYIISKKIN